MAVHIKNFPDFLRDLGKQPNSVAAEMQRLEEDLREAHEKVSEVVAQFNQTLADTAKQFEAENERFFSIIRSTNWGMASSILVQLAGYGWYVNYRFDMPQLGKIKECLDKGQITELDQLMEKWIAADWKFIKLAVLVDHPERKSVLEQAFRAHEKGWYLLSIPVFFAQIDGICGELTGYKFFLNKQLSDNTYGPKVREWASANGNKTGIEQALCEVLMYKGAFQLHEKQDNKIGFTRHSVLHGETNDYGTKINSLKAVSLLAYINDVCANG